MRLTCRIFSGMLFIQLISLHFSHSFCSHTAEGNSDDQQVRQLRAEIAELRKKLRRYQNNHQNVLDRRNLEAANIKLQAYRENASQVLLSEIQDLTGQLAEKSRKLEGIEARAGSLLHKLEEILAGEGNVLHAPQQEDRADSQPGPSDVQSRHCKRRSSESDLVTRSEIVELSRQLDIRSQMVNICSKLKEALNDVSNTLHDAQQEGRADIQPLVQSETSGVHSGHGKFCSSASDAATQSEITELRRQLVAKDIEIAELRRKLKESETVAQSQPRETLADRNPLHAQQEDHAVATNEQSAQAGPSGVQSRPGKRRLSEKDSAELRNQRSRQTIAQESDDSD